MRKLYISTWAFEGHHGNDQGAWRQQLLRGIRPGYREECMWMPKNCTTWFTLKHSQKVIPVERSLMFFPLSLHWTSSRRQSTYISLWSPQIFCFPLWRPFVFPWLCTKWRNQDYCAVMELGELGHWTDPILLTISRMGSLRTLSSVVLYYKDLPDCWTKYSWLQDANLGSSAIGLV